MSYKNIINTNWSEERTFFAITQQFLSDAGYNLGTVDGIFGKKSKAAISKWKNKGNTFDKYSEKRAIIAIVQTVFKTSGCAVGTVDGYSGPQTEQAYQEWKSKASGKPVDLWRDKFELPDDNIQKEIVSAYGNPGSHQGKIILPYPMIIAWNTEQTVKTMTCHEKVADRFQQGFKKVLSSYGPTKIHELGLDLYGGCLNVRKKRGGSTWSSHAWGVAVDIDPARNKLRWKSDRAQLAKPEYEEWWKIWESVGAISLGREKGYDWMHVQFMRT